MHKAMYERIYGKPYELDEKDKAILAERIKVWESRTDGPRVGDYVITSKGLLRLTHDWGDMIQTTVKGYSYDVSFHLSRDGYMSFSGSLDPGVPKDRLILTDEVREGTCWFFSYDYAEAHNGVRVTVPCRVYRLENEQ